MSDGQSFDHILNWQLKAGSHPFPGPDGGTCINEAAVVAAGFEYKRISGVEDFPPCFSKPIGAYALVLNDCLNDELRQKLLMPFVTRLAGTADTPKVESRRIAHIGVQVVRRIFPICFRIAGRERDALRCESVTTYEEALREAGAGAWAWAGAGAWAWAGAGAGAWAWAWAWAWAGAWAWAVKTFGAPPKAPRLKDAERIAEIAVEILGEAIALGRQAEPLEVELIQARLDKARELAPARA